LESDPKGMIPKYCNFFHRHFRYAMIVNNGKIEKQWVEEKPGELKVSSAASVLNNL
jgi:peroxiredoxin